MMDSKDSRGHVEEHNLKMGAVGSRRRGLK